MNKENNTSKHNTNTDDNDVEFEDLEESESIDKKIKKLKDELKAVKKEKADLLADFQKAKADFINLRKRDEESNKDFVKYAREGIVLELIPVLDSFDMAFSNKEAWEKAPKEWRVGVEYIHNQLLMVLSNSGITEINPLGEEFNPNLHEAIETVDVEDNSEDNKVIAIVQKGYKLGERIIRPAKVKVGNKN